MMHCAPQHELRAYCLGALPREAANAIEDHLASCPSCESALEVVESAADELVLGIRGAGAVDSPHAELSEEIAALIARVLKDVGALSTRPQESTRTLNAPPDERQTPPEFEPSIPITAAHFQALLLTNSLFSTDELRSAFVDFPGTLQDDPLALARWLVERGRLTPFQASELCRGRAQGLKLGDYEILELIGRGGMGQVYRARNERMQRDAAVKVLAQRSFDSPAAQDRFRREVRAIARISHPHVVAAFDAGEVAGDLYLAMELVDGVDLGELVRRGGPLGIDAAVDYIRQAALGLSCAHGHGIVHRDVKPSNLLVSREGTVQVSDLGLARFSLSSEADSLTETGEILGTFDYISPEQAFDTGRIGERSDIYCLGWTLYYLLTGEVPFPEAARLGKLVAHRDAPVPSLCGKRADAPPELHQLFQRMVAKNPDDRPESMQAVIDALARLPCEKRLAHPPAMPQRTAPDLDAFFLELDRQTCAARQRRREHERRLSRKRLAGWALAAAAVLLIAPLVAVGAGALLGRSRSIGSGSSSLPSTHSPIAAAPAEPAPKVVVENPAPPPAPLAATLFGEIARIELPQPIRCLALARERGLAYASAQDGLVHMIDVAAHRVVGTLEGHRRAAAGMAVSPDEKRLAASVDRSLRFWNLETGKQVLRMEQHRLLGRLAYSPNGERVLAAVDVVSPLPANIKSTSQGHSLVLMDEAGGRRNITDEQSLRFQSVAFSPQGDFVAAGGDDGTVTIANPQTSQLARRWPGHRQLIKALAFSPDGQRLYSADIGGLVLCRSVPGGETLYRRVVQHGITGIDVSGDESRLLLEGTIDVRVLDLPDLVPESLTEMHGHEAPITGLRFLASDELAISCSQDQTVRIWKLPPHLPTEASWPK